jgi:hypothetical protein
MAEKKKNPCRLVRGQYVEIVEEKKTTSKKKNVATNKE